MEDGQIMSEAKKLIKELQSSMNETLDKLYELSDEQLDNPCSHGCAMGQGVRGLLVHNIEHERMHLGQIAHVRFQLRAMQGAHIHRLLAEWLRDRTALAASLIGLPDEAMDTRYEEGEWSVRENVEHVLYWERDSVDHLVREQKLGSTPASHG